MSIPFSIIKKIKNSLKLTMGEAVSSGAVQGFGNVGTSFSYNQYIVAYALALKASNSEISLILALPLLVSSLVQLRAADLIKKLGSRKKVAVIVGLINILFWLPFIFIPFLFHSNQVWWALAFFTLITVFWTLDDPAWDSLVSDLVPLRRRGKFFGRRKLIWGISLVATSFMAGFILNSFNANILLGFFVIFSLALLARCVSWILVRRIYEPPVEISQEKRFRFSDFIKEIGHTKAGKIILLSAFMNLAIFLAAPFYSVYMLQDMKFNIMTFTVINLAAVSAILLTLGFWGKKIDSSGPIRVIALTSLCIAFVPLLWALGHKIPYLMMVQFFSGFMMAGFNLSIPAYIYIHSSPEKRAHYLSYLYALNMGMAGIGTLAGGFLVTNVLEPQLLSSKFLDLFLISGVLSSLVAFSFVSSLTEAPILFQRYFNKPKHNVSANSSLTTRMRRGLIYNMPQLPVLAPAFQEARIYSANAVLYQRSVMEVKRIQPGIKLGLYYSPYIKQKPVSNTTTKLSSSGEKKNTRGLYHFIRSIG